MGKTDPAILRALRQAMVAKEGLVRDEGPGTDLPIWLELRRGGESLGLAVPLGERDSLVAVLTAAVGFSDADQAILMAEAYTYYSAEPPPRPPGPGDLARWFAEGEPHTSECVQAVSTDRDGTVGLLQASYTFSGGSIVWGEITSQTAEGSLTDVLARGFEIQATRHTAPLPMDLLAASLGCEFIPATPLPQERPRRWGRSRRSGTS